MAALLGSYWPWYTAPSQPGSTASVFSQATWPYTQFAREIGSDKPPSRGTVFPSDLITRGLLVAVVEQIGRGNNVGYAEYGTFPVCD